MEWEEDSSSFSSLSEEEMFFSGDDSFECNFYPVRASMIVPPDKPLDQLLKTLLGQATPVLQSAGRIVGYVRQPRSLLFAVEKPDRTLLKSLMDTLEFKGGGLCFCFEEEDDEEMVENLRTALKFEKALGKSSKRASTTASGGKKKKAASKKKPAKPAVAKPAAPATNQRKAVPVSVPQETVPVAQPQEAVPVAQPQEAVPVAQSQEAVPATKPHEAVPASKPQPSADQPDSSRLPAKPATASQPRARPHPAVLVKDQTVPDCQTLLARPTDGSSLHKLKPALFAKTLAALQPKPLTYRRIKNGGIAVDFPSSTDLTSLLASTSFGDVPVKFSRPSQPSQFFGTIRCPDFSDAAEVQDLYELHEENPSLLQVERLGKTTVYKLTFQDSLPAAVTLCYQRFTVAPFFRAPVRCFKCQRFGHFAAACRGKEHCGYCGVEGHSFKTCPKTSLRCANCGKPHEANSPSCSHRQFFVGVAKQVAVGAHPVAARATVARSYASVAKQGPGKQPAKQAVPVKTSQPAPSVRTSQPSVAVKPSQPASPKQSSSQPAVPVPFTEAAADAVVRVSDLPGLLLAVFKLIVPDLPVTQSSILDALTRSLEAQP